MGFTLITSCLVHASEVPTIDFSGKTKQELNQMAIEQDLQLTPRSKQSLLNTVDQLEITAESDNFINGFLHQRELRLTTMDNWLKFKLLKAYYQQHGHNPVSDAQQSSFSVIVISIPVAAAAQVGYGPHGLGCTCPWPDAAAPSQKNGGSWWQRCSLQ
jgi:hypothetical protein